MTRHPARYSPQLIPHFEKLLSGYARIIDPFAGTGERLRTIRPDAVLNELEQDWATVSPGAVCGDALHLPFAEHTFDAVITSPTYGNRMADSFVDRQPQKKYKRNTYTHALSKQLRANNSGAMQWGVRYCEFHKMAWREAIRILRPGGRFVLNISDHIRNGAREPVSNWHYGCLIWLGMEFVERLEVATPRQRQGQNGTARVECEYIFVMEKP